jgi:hypothetical protein
MKRADFGGFGSLSQLALLLLEHRDMFGMCHGVHGEAQAVI